MPQDIITVLRDLPFGKTVPDLFELCTGYASRAEMLTDLSNLLAQGKVTRVGTVITMYPATAIDPVTPETLAKTLMGNGHIREMLTGGDIKEKDMRGGRPQNPDQEKILEFFRQDPDKVYSKEDLKKAFPDIKDFNLSYYIQNLCNDGSVKRHSRGIYSVNGPVQSIFRPTEELKEPLVIPSLGTAKSNEKALTAIRHLELLVEGHQATLDTIQGALLRLKRDIIGN